jgi:hypothetical protein
VSSEAGENQKAFFEHWFSGLTSGLEQIEPKARKTILRECGKACSDSYTAAVFAEAWQESDGMESFLAVLGSRFPGSEARLVDERTIEVIFSACGCDLVTSGLIRTPLLCECSVESLRDNFERVLGRPVSVTLVRSILQGAERCELRVEL